MPIAPRTHHPITCLICFAVAAFTLPLAGCSDEKAPQPLEPQAVRVVIAGHDSIPGSDSASGLVGSQEELRLGFKTGGVINRVLVNAGDAIRAGQTLAALDTTEADAQVRQISEGLSKARRDADRADTLFKQGVIAEQMLQDARTQVAMMESNLSAARFNRQQAVIVAPADGVVLQRLAEAREVAGPGVPVLVVSRADRGWVLRVGLNDRAATRTAIGDRATIRLNAYPDQVLTGVVREIGAASDPRTGTVTVTLSLPNRAGIKYIAGQVGNAQLQSADANVRQLTVPLGAILEGQGHLANIYVIDTQNRARRKQIRTGEIEDGRVAVISGLQAGERVVSEGAAWLNPGAPVRILQ